MTRSSNGKIKKFFEAAKLYNQYKTKKYKPEPLVGADLRGININFVLYDVEFIDCNLQGVKLTGRKDNGRGGTYENVSFKGSNLSNATVLGGVDFVNCIFDDSILNRAVLEDVKFINSSLKNADLLYANLLGATFRKCDLRNIDMTGAMVDIFTTFSNSRFNKFKLPDADSNYELYKTYYRALIETFDLAFYTDHLDKIIGYSSEEGDEDYNSIINAPI